MALRRTHVFATLVCIVAILGIAMEAIAEDDAKAKGKEPMTLGVLLYPGFELLDVFGPLEMFINVGADRLKIVMVAENAGPIRSGSLADPGPPTGPAAVADFGFDDAPHLDIILVPGGIGTIPQLANTKLLTWLKERAAKAEISASVCSGSALLAKAGLLDGHKATSNKQFFSLATSQSDKVDWVEKARWVDDGKTITSSGVSAGIDMALAMIERLFDEKLALTIAEMTEYQWHRDPNDDPFAQFLK